MSDNSAHSHNEFGFSLAVRPSANQLAFGNAPYDEWISPWGEVIARFHRTRGGFLVRFPDRADFIIDVATRVVACTPASKGSPEDAATLYENCIVPLISNHQSGLHVHGSAVEINGCANIFVGPSRRGKTTLAAALAARQHALLSEDAVDLRRLADGTYMVATSRPVVRLFPDSAGMLLGELPENQGSDGKICLGRVDGISFADTAVPLGKIFLLGPGTSPEVQISPLGPAQSLAELMQHAFVLDVEDRERLRAHFCRMATLASSVDSYLLDYPRDFGILPEVVQAIVSHCPPER